MPATNESLSQNEQSSFFRATLVDRNWAVCLVKASSLSCGAATETPESSIESWAPTQTTRSPRQALSQERGKPRMAMASSATVKIRDLSPGLHPAARSGSSTWISQRNSSPLKTDDTTRPMAAANRPQILGDDLPSMPRTSKTKCRAPTFPHTNCCSDCRIGMTTSHVSTNPEVVPAVLHRIFQPWQYGDGGIDVRPKKIPDMGVLRSSILFEFGAETELGQHNMASTLVSYGVRPGYRRTGSGPWLLGPVEVASRLEAGPRVISPTREAGKE